MLRYYCDSNIYRFIKPSYKNYKPKLHLLMEKLKDKVLFCFSTAHIEDLRGSTKEYLLEDLQCIGKYVKDNYFARNHLEKEFNFYLATPKEVYETFDFSEEDYKPKDFSFENILKGNDFPEFSLALDMLDSLLDLPIGYLSTSEINPNNDSWINETLPNGKNTTIKEFMDAVGKMVWDKNEFKKYRNFVKSTYNDEDYNYESWGMEFNEKFRNSPIQKSFLEFVELSLSDNQKDDFFLKFNSAYNILEAMNITVEKVGKKKKKNTFRSLSVDAQHVYYASYSDYLISDDAGLRLKALILYSLFGIKTKVLSVQDFLNRQSTIIGQEENSISFFNTLTHDLKTSMLLSNTYSFEYNERFNTFKTSHLYFNYFNRFQTINFERKNILSLYCDRGVAYNNIIYREVELIISKLISIFSVDDNLKGLFLFMKKVVVIILLELGRSKNSVLVSL